MYTSPPHRLLLSALSLAAALPALAASHSDAPLIKQDPQANITDVYAFIGSLAGDPGTEVLNVLVQVRPFSEPGDGPHYDRFADDARYSIHLADPTSGQTLVRYDFQFSAVNDDYKNPDTILSYGLGTAAGAIQTVGDARQNYTQTYSVKKTALGSTSLLASGLVSAPPNAGNNVTPLYNDAQGIVVSGATDPAGLDAYTQQAIHALPSGETVFAGPRDDGFYADIPGTFDLLNIRIIDNNGDPNDGLGQDGGGVNGFKGFNVLAYAIQIPLSEINGSSGSRGSMNLTGDDDDDDDDDDGAGRGDDDDDEEDLTLARAFDSVFFGPQTGIGVYASVSRQKVRVLQADGNTVNSGPWMQINRMGNPVFNEAFVALRDKDNYNRTNPVNDADFASYAQNPELAVLVNLVLFGDPTGQSPIVTQNRTDLVAVFIPDVLRVVTTTGPVPLAGQPGFNRLGFIGNDTTAGVSSGWPNGRRLGDDVIDVALTALASGPAFKTITVVGDNAAANDLPYNQVFPYGATPHSGTTNRKDPP